MKDNIFSPLIWIIAVFALLIFITLNWHFDTVEQAADEAYRVQVVAQKKAAQDKAFNDLAARGEFMTTFAAVSK